MLTNSPCLRVYAALLAAALTLPLSACGSDAGAEDSGSTGETTGAPNTNCFGEDGPELDWSFAQAAGEYSVQTAAACLPQFEANTPYALSVDASARSLSIVTEVTTKTYVWDGDALDGACAIEGAPEGVQLTVMDASDNGLSVELSAAGELIKMSGWVDGPTGCTLFPAAG